MIAARNVRCAVLLAFSALAPITAQERPEPVAVFDASYARAEQLRLEGKAEADAIRAAYRTALLDFFRIPQQAPGYAARVGPGGYCAELAGDGARALELYDEALASRPGDLWLFEARLRALVLVGHGAEALDSALAAEAPRDAAARAFVQSGGTAVLEEAGRRLRTGDTLAGLFVFRELAEARGQVGDLCNLALALRFLGELEESVALYERALARTPDDELTWNDYGLTLLAAGRRREAVVAFEKSRALETVPGAGPATTNLALMTRRAGPAVLPDPLAALRQVMTTRPDTLFARWLYVDALMARERTAGRVPGVVTSGRSHDKVEAKR